MGRSGFVIVCVRESGCDKTTVMRVTTRSDFVWMPPNHFNLHLSARGNRFINHRVHLSSVWFSAYTWNCKSWKGELQLVRTAVIHASGDMLSPLARFLHLQTPGGVTAVCWHANVSPTTLQLLRFPHLSQDMFITHSFGPKISVGTRQPRLCDESTRCLPCHPLFQIEGSPPSFAPPCPSHLHASVLYFSHRNISQQGCAQQGPQPRLQRTSHYPSRWCANVAVDIKVFQLIIIRGIHWRQLSLSYNLATMCGILAEERWWDAMVTLSWGQQSDTCW